MHMCIEEVSYICNTSSSTATSITVLHLITGINSLKDYVGGSITT